jgi:hypothetical protein
MEQPSRLPGPDFEQGVMVDELPDGGAYTIQAGLVREEAEGSGPREEQRRTGRHPERMNPRS